MEKDPEIRYKKFLNNSTNIYHTHQSTGTTGAGGGSFGGKPISNAIRGRGRSNVTSGRSTNMRDKDSNKTYIPSAWNHENEI